MRGCPLPLWIPARPQTGIIPTPILTIAEEGINMAGLTGAEVIITPAPLLTRVAGGIPAAAMDAEVAGIVEG